MDYSLYLKKGLMKALQESIADAHPEVRSEEKELGENAAKALQDYENYKQELEKNGQQPDKDILTGYRDAIAKFVSFLNTYSSDDAIDDNERKYLVDYNEHLKAINKMLNSENAGTTETNEEQTSEESLDNVADPEDIQEATIEKLVQEYYSTKDAEIVNKIVEQLQQAEDTSSLVDSIYGALINEVPAFYAYETALKKADATSNSMASADQEQAVKQEAVQKEEELKAEIPDLWANETIKSLLVEKLKTNISSDAKAQEAAQMEAQLSGPLAEAFNNNTPVSVAPDSKFSGMTIKQIWAQGFKDLAMITYSMDGLRKDAVKCGLAVDALQVLGILGSACSAIGMVGTIASHFLPPGPTKLIVSGAFRVLIGVGGMSKTLPNTVKAFKEGDIKKGLAYTAATIASGMAIYSGVNSIHKGIDWKIAQNFASQLTTAEGRAGLLKDIDERISNTKDPTQLEQLNASKAAVENVNQGVANGLINEQDLQSYVSDPTSKAQLSTELNNVIGPMNEEFAQSQAEADMLGAQSELDSANEFAAEHGGYTSQQCADYILKRAGTGANGGWINSTKYPTDPQLEAVARDWANKHPDIIKTTYDIQNCNNQIAVASEAVTQAQANVDAAINSDMNVLDDARFTKGTEGIRDLLGKTYGGTSRVAGTGFGANSQFTLKDPMGTVQAKQDVVNFLSGKTEGMTPDQLKCAEYLANQGKTDLANNISSPIAGIVKTTQDFNNAQHSLTTAKQGLAAAYQARSAAIGTESTILNAIKNNPTPDYIAPQNPPAADTPTLDLNNAKMYNI